jgi:hypothetical protein
MPCVVVADQININGDADSRKVEAKKKLCTMIADVIAKNGQYYTLDQNNREIAHEYESSIGELLGFNSNFMLFLRNSQYYTRDERFKEIANDYKSSLGEFRNVSGNNANFERNDQIYVRDMFLKEISHRYK